MHTDSVPFKSLQFFDPLIILFHLQISFCSREVPGDSGELSGFLKAAVRRSGSVSQQTYK